MIVLAEAASIDEFLAFNHLGFTIAFWFVTLLAVIVSVVRRSFLDTPHGHYHPRFRDMRVPADFDEAAKLDRIGLNLAFVHHVVRGVWIALFLGVGIGQTEWPWYLSYLPPQSSGPAFHSQPNVAHPRSQTIAALGGSSGRLFGGSGRRLFGWMRCRPCGGGGS